MQIINGQPVFGTNDSIFSHDDKYAYDAQRNVMGLYNPLAVGNALNTDKTSFMDFLQTNGIDNLEGSIGYSGQQPFGALSNPMLTGANAEMWGQNNPYAQFLLQGLIAKQPQTPMAIQSMPTPSPQPSGATTNGVAPSQSGGFDLIKWLSDVFSQKQSQNPLDLGGQSTIV